MNKAQRLITLIELGIKGGDIDGFEQKIRAIQKKHKGNYAGDTLDTNIDNMLESPDQISSVLAFRTSLAVGKLKLREPKDIKDTDIMIKDLDKIIGRT